ncbi:hypothetical protein HanRHA438_Chr14g0636231 [Helianthus annuus]|nr:hypothetical protein HanRHA438_Chr14g0636231 [Helianthus annuus]
MILSSLVIHILGSFPLASFPPILYVPTVKVRIKNEPKNIPQNELNAESKP